MNPIVLETPNVYYEIDINIKEATYSLKTYSVSEATDPINYEYGQLCDMPRDAGEPQFNFYIGWGDSPQNAGEHLLCKTQIIRICFIIRLQVRLGHWNPEKR